LRAKPVMLHVASPHAWRFVRVLTATFICVSVWAVARAGVADPPAAASADWPMFRGNGHLTGVASSPLTAQPKQRWRIQLDEAVTSSAAIVGDTAYLGCDDGHLYALSLADGSIRWKYSTQVEPAEKPTTQPADTADDRAAIRASPTWHNGRLYIGDEYGVFHAVDAKTGRRLWTFETDAEIVSSANCHGDRLVVGSYDGYLYCLALDDGRLIWKHETEGRVHGTPSIVDGKTFVAGCDGLLHVVDLADGKLIRSVDLGGVSGTAAAVRGNRVVIGTFSNTVLAIDWRKGERVWTFEDADKGYPFYASAAVTGELAIVGGRDRFVRAMDLTTGKQRWEFKTRGRVDASPVVVGGRVYVGSLDGILYGLDLASGREVWRFEAGGPISASPAIGQSQLVFGTENGVVYCCGGSD